MACRSLRTSSEHKFFFFGRFRRFRSKYAEPHILRNAPARGVGRRLASFMLRIALTCIFASLSIVVVVVSFFFVFEFFVFKLFLLARRRWRLCIFSSTWHRIRRSKISLLTTENSMALATAAASFERVPRLSDSRLVNMVPTSTEKSAPYWLPVFTTDRLLLVQHILSNRSSPWQHKLGYTGHSGPCFESAANTSRCVSALINSAVEKWRLSR